MGRKHLPPGLGIKEWDVGRVRQKKKRRFAMKGVYLHQLFFIKVNIEHFLLGHRTTKFLFPQRTLPLSDRLKITRQVRALRETSRGSVLYVVLRKILYLRRRLLLEAEKMPQKELFVSAVASLPHTLPPGGQVKSIYLSWRSQS